MYLEAYENRSHVSMENIVFLSFDVECMLKHDTKQNTYSHATEARERIELLISFSHFFRTHLVVYITKKNLSKTHKRILYSPIYFSTFMFNAFVLILAVSDLYLTESFLHVITN